MPMKSWLDCIQNIVGPQGLKSVLNHACLEKYVDNSPSENDVLEVPVDDLRSLFFSLYEVFGDKCTYSLQLRLGREQARIAIKEYAPSAKTIQVAACLLPEPKKMHMVLEKMKEQIEKVYRTQIELREEGSSFLLTTKNWIESEGVMSTVPVCGAFVGMLQYTMEWITGYPHEVEEIECRAMGHPADVFRISKVRKV